MKAVLHTPTIRIVTITNIIISVFIPYEHGTAFALILPGWPSISAEQLPSPPAAKGMQIYDVFVVWGEV